LSLHSKSKKICLDDKNKLRIHSRFLTKYHEGPNTQAHVCLIFDKHRCWYVGINSNREQAEVDALKQWLKCHHHSKQKKEKDRRTWRMMVVRFSKTGIFNNSKPCFHCSSFLKKYSDYFHSISFSDDHVQA